MNIYNKKGTKIPNSEMKSFEKLEDRIRSATIESRTSRRERAEV